MLSGEFITVEEVARLLKIRRETIRGYIKKGYLKAVTLPSGDYRLCEKEIQKLLRRPSQKEVRDGG
jgi:excisionase family DNA binding protein